MDQELKRDSLSAVRRGTTRRRMAQSIMFGLFRGAAALNGFVLLVVVAFLLAKGWRAINWDFLTQPPVRTLVVRVNLTY